MSTTFNLFPDLLSFAILAPIILRVVAGLIFVNIGSLKLNKEKVAWIKSLKLLGIEPAGFFVGLLGIIETVGGVLLIAGAYTQVTALILGIICLCELLIENKEESLLKRDFVFYLMLTAICLSLVLTGAGLFAFDYPNL